MSDDAEKFGNCSEVFRLIDTNNNGYVGLHEGIVALTSLLDVWAFQSNVDWELKLRQIDCSACVGYNQTVYYM